MREILNLLDEVCPAASEAGGEGAAKQDIASRLQDELNELRDESKQRFKVHRGVGVNGMFFVQFLRKNGAPEPLEAALAICKDALESKTCKAR